MTNRSAGVFASGFRFPEGPAFDRCGNLFVVDIDTGRVSKISTEGKMEVFVHTGGEPNGAAFHANGDLYIADRTKGIMAVSPDGFIRVIADQFQGRKFYGPNDLAFDYRGNLYFTDPLGSSSENPFGCIYRISNDGEITCMATGLPFPNGLLVNKEGSCLFVAITRKNRILRYVLDPPPFRSYLFSQFTGGWGPDGMALDEQGHLYIAHYGGGDVLVVNPKGGLIERIPVGGNFPTNLAFGGPDRKTLYVTEVETGSVYRIETDSPGLELYSHKKNERILKE
ncbi:MAG: SMP-30/gluconolactonase/LRE family protein [Deltaproteobacteria bacterium]|nr:SMP-30/gluconolactonase/LRE family protein [Deltaproteobacteria bacterium]